MGNCGCGDYFQLPVVVWYSWWVGELERELAELFPVRFHSFSERFKGGNDVTECNRTIFHNSISLDRT